MKRIAFRLGIDTIDAITTGSGTQSRDLKAEIAFLRRLELQCIEHSVAKGHVKSRVREAVHITTVKRLKVSNNLPASLRTSQSPQSRDHSYVVLLVFAVWRITEKNHFC